MGDSCVAAPAPRRLRLCGFAGAILDEQSHAEPARCARRFEKPVGRGMEGAFEAAQPVVTQLLKAETAERQVRAVTHELNNNSTGCPYCARPLR